MTELTEIYTMAFRALGFGREVVKQGLAMVDREKAADRYVCFEAVVSQLERRGHVLALRRDDVEQVFTVVEHHEAKDRVARRAAQGATEREARRLDEADRRAVEARETEAKTSRALELLEATTDDEFTGRKRMRPEIAEAWQDFARDTSGR